MRGYIYSLIWRRVDFRPLETVSGEGAQVGRNVLRGLWVRSGRQENSRFSPCFAPVSMAKHLGGECGSPGCGLSTTPGWSWWETVVPSRPPELLSSHLLVGQIIMVFF